jgi:hypothetical protein
MAEIGTGIALAVLGGPLLYKLLGPTADYLGEGLKGWSAKALENLNNIFSNAAYKLGDNIEHEGRVPPRVLKGILFDASFCDDPLFQEYFGGVLASSRSNLPRDDRGAYFIELINRLSNYQLRSHYMFYHIIKILFDGADIDPSFSEGRAKMNVFIPNKVYTGAMGFDEKEKANFSIYDHSLSGLGANDLIESGFWGVGSKKELGPFIRDYPSLAEMSEEGGIIFRPSLLGIELFHWAYGRPDLTAHNYLKTSNHFELLTGVNIPVGSLIVKD